MSESQIIEAVKPSPRKFFNPALWIALTALGVSGWQLYTTQQELLTVRHELARRLAENSGSAKELRVLAEQAINANRSIETRVGQLDARVNEFSGQYATLNGMYQELTKNRSDWLLAEVEYTLTIASQQLQLAGNVSAAIAGLEMLDARLSKFDRPQLIGVKKALATDLETLKALPYLDSVGLTVKLDRLILATDSLPLVVDSHRLPGQNPSSAASSVPANAPIWQRLLADLSRSLRELVQIRRMDKPEALLLSPEQSFFLRENLKMRLLGARLALIQRDGKTFVADITSARNYVQRYFDSQAPATKQWLLTLGELEGAPLDVTLPDLGNSLKAVRDAQNSAGE
ncbi:uroporphyrinogen-III C-methyltransferase [Neisseriaceae bacterium TC5R-5]|nr:uroporphyrinogen-III C-methyltransferase [Neisseriaceae bacterium TC5R-5]